LVSLLTKTKRRLGTVVLLAIKRDLARSAKLFKESAEARQAFVGRKSLLELVLSNVTALLRSAAASRGPGGCLRAGTSQTTIMVELEAVLAQCSLLMAHADSLECGTWYVLS